MKRKISSEDIAKIFAIATFLIILTVGIIAIASNYVELEAIFTSNYVATTTFIVTVIGGLLAYKIVYRSVWIIANNADNIAAWITWVTTPVIRLLK